MVIVFLIMHFAPSIYWAATHSTIVAPLLWSLVGAAYSATAKWRARDADLISTHAYLTGKAKSILLGAAFTGLLFSGVLNVVGYFVGRALILSTGTPRIVEAAVFGYLLAGLHQVLCDLRRPVFSQPAYVSAGSTSIASVTSGLLGWVLVSFFNLRWARGTAFWDTVFSWLTVIGVTCALLLI